MTALLWFPCPYSCGQMVTPQPGETDAQALDFHLWMLCGAVPTCNIAWDSELEPGVTRRCTRYAGHPDNHWQ